MELRERGYINVLLGWLLLWLCWLCECWLWWELVLLQLWLYELRWQLLRLYYSRLLLFVVNTGTIKGAKRRSGVELRSCRVIRVMRAIISGY